METCLVTGGAGFIGSHLVHSLLTQGKKVKVLDNLYTGKKENLKEVLKDIEFIEGDITDNDAVRRTVRGVNTIFHLGAVPSVPKSIKNPLLTNHVNVTGTLQILHAAVEFKVKKVIYSASSSAYGNSNSILKNENMTAAPLSPYAVSKFTGELYCKVFYELYGLETVSLRFFNIFGPRQYPNSQYAAVIPIFIYSILRNESPTIFGDGNQSRDFTYVDNVVSANLLAEKAQKLQGEVVNIGCGSRTCLNELVAKINSILGKKINPIYAENRKGEVKYSCADIQKATDLLSYKPHVFFDEGLEKTVEWFAQNMRI